jgi:hypothetical protein
MGTAIQILRPGRRRAASWADRWALRRRRMLAAALQRALDDARRPLRGLTARVGVERTQVLDAADDLERLIGRLRDTERPVSDEALAAARELLCDGSGPLCAWAEPGTLRRRIRVICEAVE